MFEKYNDVLLPQDIKEILHIGTNKTYALLQNGTIRSVQCGKKYLIPKIFLEEYLL